MNVIVWDQTINGCAHFFRYNSKHIDFSSVEIFHGQLRECEFGVIGFHAAQLFANQLSKVAM